MVYECFRRTIDSANVLGIKDALIDELEAMLPHLKPVLIGDDGQIKEFREETTYSSIGEPLHRHVSHLVGLYPGTVINEKHPEWLKAAEVTLNRRGDRTHCWAAAHRMLLWTRTGNGDRAFDLLQSLIQNNVMENLWDRHPPFQIDGNFGYTAGVSEMLLGGSDGTVIVLQALPSAWKSGEYSGIVSRGGIVFDCRWDDGRITYLAATAKRDITVNILLPEGSALDTDSSAVSLAAGKLTVLINKK
jgi:alpha-L-fucosidase 2